MKVLCINAEGIPKFDAEIGKCPLVEGQSYTAEKSEYPSNYFIVEIGLCYIKERFIPCSDQENIVLEDVLVLKNQ